MRLLHNWEIVGKATTEEVLKTIFHPNLARFYLSNSGLKDIKDLRITLTIGDNRSTIGFYEEKK